MLAHLTINNFAIVKKLDLEFRHGMTTITGETGAGKSIAIDALGLCLGDRAEASMVRPGEEKTEISASFSLSNNIAAKRWLEDNELIDGDECIVRRVITKEGRSRAFINGSPVPASQQKSLGQLLINIHGQHAHQQLMKSDSQLALLDQYASHHGLLATMRQTYQAWRSANVELKHLRQNQQELEAQRQLLEYQVKELNELALGETEFAEIEEEHKRLSSSGDIALSGQSALEMLTENDDTNAVQLLKAAQSQLATLSDIDPTFGELVTMLEEATIQAQEAGYELTRYLESLDMDPQRLQFLDERMSKIMSLARKHHVMPDELYGTHQSLLAELEKLGDGDSMLEALELDVAQKHQVCLEAAEKLSKSRLRYAKELNKLITQSMQELNMEKGKFEIAFERLPQSNVTPLGFDNIEFQVCTNPGQPLQSMAKVASGGELSRISLAIQVITAQKVETPSLIFDEVDVGISGPTAAIVGKMLRKLGNSTRYCV